VGRLVPRRGARDASGERSVRRPHHRRGRLPHDRGARGNRRTLPRAHDPLRDRPSLRRRRRLARLLSPRRGRRSLERRRGRHRAPRRRRHRRGPGPAQHVVRLERDPPRLRKRERRRRVRARDVRDRARRRRLALRVLIGESMTWLLLLACQSPIIEIDYLAVTALSPQNEAGDIAVDAEMLVTFSEPLVSESVDDTTVLLSATDGTPIAIDVRYAETDNTVIATPMDPLAYDAAYTFVISSDVEGEETGPM